jgi:hypothetical protein
LSEEKKEEITREEAESTLKLWAEAVELDTERELFKDILVQLTGVVMQGRMKFDEETETFTYHLLKPVKDKNFVEIRETDFEQKKSLQKFKDGEDMDAAGMMMAKHTNLTTIEILKLKTRDQKRINAVIMGFLSQ